MSVSLENLFMANKSIQNTQTGGQSQPVNSAVNQLLQDMFSTGDVISGKVSSMQGNVVELLLPSGQSLSAILGQNVSVNMGEQMMFAVKGMTGNQMELNPLFINTANTTTIMKALDGAGLPKNEQNVTMVQHMMERGMSVQKDALLSMKRSVSQFPSSPIEDVVTLRALKMPVNETNLIQLSAYKNGENQLMKPIMEMLSEVPNAFDALVNAGETGKAVSLYKDVIQLFGEMPNQSVKQTDASVNPMMLKPEDALQGEQGKVILDANVAENVNLGENSEFSTAKLKQLLQKFGMENGQIEAVLKDNPSKQAVMKLISEQISNSRGLTEESLTEIFKDPVFKLFMKEAGDELSTLSPKEIAQHENIDNLYEHLQKRADKILENLAGKEDFALVKSAQNFKANVNFMNQVNQMYQYVQLPLKFTESHANGELYVYGNGKKLSLEDGNVSALLHLDMEHLGTVDIHVEMNSQKEVKTNFYFEDEAMLDFIYEHIDMLNERLEKRGYGPVTNVQMRDEMTKTPVSEIFETKEETPVSFQNQSFDARI
ncbi:MAG: flagellar hook-length control protein FliK [Lachnospiraceae bacterium]|nr:flagellar hook-length control protein FliK [Lachnospiraceae bacterium]